VRISRYYLAPLTDALLATANATTYALPVNNLGETTVIFARRLWATRIIKKAGFRVPSREARLVIDLLMRTSKKTSKGLPTAEQVLFSALRVVQDKKAVAKVAEELAVSPSAAELALAKLPKAAITLAAENRMRQFVEVANRVHIP
jgi:hypothetical protein